MALTCGETSPLAREADDVVILPFTPLSRRTPHTLDYLVTVEALAVLGLHWVGESADPLHEILTLDAAMAEAAREFAEDAVAGMDPDGKIFLLGGGPDLATASYGAAKFHEAGGIPAFRGGNRKLHPRHEFHGGAGGQPLRHRDTPLSIRRGAEVATNFRSFLKRSSLIEPEPFDGIGWQSAFASLLSTTLKMQHLCLAYANRFGLDVELPRAGRAFGDQHAEIQARIMAM